MQYVGGYHWMTEKTGRYGHQLFTIIKNEKNSKKIAGKLDFRRKNVVKLFSIGQNGRI